MLVLGNLVKGVLAALNVRAKGLAGLRNVDHPAGYKIEYCAGFNQAENAIIETKSRVYQSFMIYNSVISYRQVKEATRRRDVQCL